VENITTTNVPPIDGFIVEIDGKFESEYGTLMAALKAGLELRQKFPHMQVKVYDADEQARRLDDEKSAA